MRTGEKSQLHKKSLRLAVLCSRYSQYLIHEKKEFVLSKQFLRCSTSVGANIKESEFAESKKDFVHKLSVALKEANEANFWIKVLLESEMGDEKLLSDIDSLCIEVIKMLVSSINTARRNLNN